MKQAKPSIKANKLTLKAKKPHAIKAALKAWVKASDKVDPDPLNLDDAPVWVEAAWIEMAKVIMPSRWLLTHGDLDLELLGELFGRLQALTKLFGGEIPIGPEMTAEYNQFENFMASQPQSPERTAKEKLALRDFKTRLTATNQSIPEVMSAVLKSSHEDALKFQKGLLRRMTLAPDELTSGKTFQRHTRTYFVLALFWRFWVTCKSLREVYRYLCQAVGEQKIGSFKTFEKLCDKIGFKLRGRGRPPGKK